MKNDYNFMFLLTHIYRKIYTAFYSWPNFTFIIHSRVKIKQCKSVKVSERMNANSTKKKNTLKELMNYSKREISITSNWLINFYV
jgi:hypothetical protein